MDEEQIKYVYKSANYLLRRKGYLTASDIEEYTQDVAAHVAKYWGYDPSKGYSWKTYAVRAIRNRLGTLMKKHFEQLHEELEEEDRIVDEHRNVDEELDMLIDDLIPDADVRQIVRMKVQGYTQQVISQELGLHVQSGYFIRLWRAVAEAVRTGEPMDCSSFLLDSHGSRGRPSAYKVLLLSESGRVESEYPSVAQAEKALGIPHEYLSWGKDGAIHEWRGYRWRLVDNRRRKV